MNMWLLSEGDPSLKNSSSEWDFTSDGDPTELVKNLSKILIQTGAVGLSAPQCGVFKRIFVIGDEYNLHAYINPNITWIDTVQTLDVEGCLSFPNLWLKVTRPKSCTIQYQTITGETVSKTLTGLHARIALHEYDHLNGVLFTSKVSSLSLDLAKRKRKKSQK